MPRSTLSRVAPISTAVLALALVVLLNVAGRRDLTTEPIARISRLRQAGLYAEAEPYLLQLVNDQPQNVVLHYQYINNHFDISGLRARQESDRELERFYTELGSDQLQSDIGNYGLGLMRTLQGRFDEAEQYYRRVANTRQQYLNNSIGYLYLKRDMPPQALEYFRKEIEIGGNVQGAVTNMLNIYVKQNNLAGIEALLEDSTTSRHVNPGVARHLWFRTGRIMNYLHLVLVGPIRSIAAGPALVALLICIMWFLYFWRIDVFEHEPAILSLSVLLLGGMCALLSAIPADLLALVYPISLGENGLTDLNYSIFHIGLVEESVKLLPVLLVATLSQQINEPMDLLYYGSLSALGFATVENAMYFSGFGIGIAFTRFLFSTVIHMAMTSIICYQWARARFISLRNPVLGIIGGFLVASIVHGLFDYFIIGPFKELSIFSLLLVLGLAIIYGRMITNLLNFSPFFDARLSTSRALHNFSLLFSTAAVLFAITYLYNNFHFSTGIANRKILEVLGATVVSVAVVFGALGAFTLHQKRLLSVLATRRS